MEVGVSLLDLYHRDLYSCVEPTPNITNLKMIPQVKGSELIAVIASAAAPRRHLDHVAVLNCHYTHFRKKILSIFTSHLT